MTSTLAAAPRPKPARPIPSQSPLDQPRHLWPAAICLLVLQFSTNLEVAIMTAELMLVLWIAFHPQDQSAGRLLAFSIWQYPCFAMILSSWGVWLDHANPWKFDPTLYSIDRWLGFDGFAFARMASGSGLCRIFAQVCYEGLYVTLPLWFALQFRRRTHMQFFIALVAVFGIGGWVYWILPACGPRFAFAGFPALPLPTIQSRVQKLSGIANCMPSLHIATAMLFIQFPVGDRGTRVFAWLFLVGTVFGTLMGQHYAIDLVMAVPFGLSCAALARRDWLRAGVLLAATAGPLLLIRLLA